MSDELTLDLWKPRDLTSLLFPGPAPFPAPYHAPNPSLTYTAPATPTHPAPAPAPNASKRVTNTYPKPEWKMGRIALKPIITRSKDIPGGEIPQADNGDNFCLTWHFKGSCFSECKGKGTHRLPTAAKTARLDMWHKLFCARATTPPVYAAASVGPYTHPSMHRPPRSISQPKPPVPEINFPADATSAASSISKQE